MKKTYVLLGGAAILVVSILFYSQQNKSQVTINRQESSSTTTPSSFTEPTTNLVNESTVEDSRCSLSLPALWKDAVEERRASEIKRLTEEINNISRDEESIKLNKESLEAVTRSKIVSTAGEYNGYNYCTYTFPVGLNGNAIGCPEGKTCLYTYWEKPFTRFKVRPFNSAELIPLVQVIAFSDTSNEPTCDLFHRTANKKLVEDIVPNTLKSQFDVYFPTASVAFNIEVSRSVSQTDPKFTCEN